MAKTSAAAIATSRIGAAIDALSDDRTFVLVSPCDVIAKPGWNGSCFYVPPLDEVVIAVRRDSKGNPLTFESYKDPETGEYIPGTLCVWDCFVEGPLGPEKTLDVVRAIRECLGIVKDKRTGKVTFEKDWGAAGVSVVTDGASRAEVEAAREEGMKRWKEHCLAQSEMEVHAYESMNAARTRSGMPALPDTPSVAASRELVQHLAADRREKLRARFDISRVRGTQNEKTKEVIRVPAQPAV